jgi:hypothetical protein
MYDSGTSHNLVSRVEKQKSGSRTPLQYPDATVGAPVTAKDGACKELGNTQVPQVAGHASLMPDPWT